MHAQLELEGLPRPLVRVTPAKLACWTSCPRRYRMTYLDKPAPPRGGAWAHNTLGAVVHNALRAYFDRPAARRSPEAAAGLVATQWSSEGFRDAAQADEYRSRAQEWVRSYVASLEPDFAPLAVEHWVSTSTDRIVAEGRVDRIDDRAGELVVVDYKTGRHGLTVEDARDSQALALYALATGRSMHRRCARVELHHLPTGRVSVWEHTRETIDGHVYRAEQAADDIDRAAEALGAGGDPEALFPPRVARHCSSCEVRRNCPEGQAGAPRLDPWALLAR